MKKTNPWTHSPKVIWNINSIQWYLGLVIKPSAACVSALIWGAVTRSRPCVADSRTVGQLRAHRQQCLTHPQFSIVQTNANQATADTVWTAWGEIVRDEGWMSIPDERIESNEMAAEMGVGAPKHRPCSWRSPTFRSLSKHCFSIVFVVIWNAFVCNKYSSIVAFIGEPRGGQHFFIKPS